MTDGMMTESDKRADGNDDDDDNVDGVDDVDGIADVDDDDEAYNIVQCPKLWISSSEILKEIPKLDQDVYEHFISKDYY